MNKYLLLFLLLGIACTTKEDKEIPPKKEYPNTIGDIAFDKEWDDPSFQICRDQPYSAQYYHKGGVSYTGELSAIKKAIFSNYKSPKLKGETGYVTVRFLVNCKGQAGLFRHYATDFELKEKKFNQQITAQFLDLTKKLNGWEIFNNRGTEIDYYQYLTFKIIDSDLIEILP